MTDLIGAWLGLHTTPAELLQDASASRIAALRTRLGKLAEEQQNPRALCALIASGRVTPGHIALSLDRDALAQHLETDAGRIAPAALDLTSELTLRRRGVETKLILDDAAPKVDQRLLRHIVLGHAWFAEIKDGTSIHQIAEREGTTRQRVSAIVGLAFLAPDLVRAIAEGRHPVEMTSDRLIKTRLPMLWSDQRDLFAKA